MNRELNTTLALALSMTSAATADFIWSGAGGDKDNAFHSGLNWSAGTVPGRADNWSMSGGYADATDLAIQGHADMSNSAAITAMSFYLSAADASATARLAMNSSARIDIAGDAFIGTRYGGELLMDDATFTAANIVLGAEGSLTASNGSWINANTLLVDGSTFQLEHGAAAGFDSIVLHGGGLTAFGANTILDVHNRVRINHQSASQVDIRAGAMVAMPDLELSPNGALFLDNASALTIGVAGHHAGQLTVAHGAEFKAAGYVHAADIANYGTMSIAHGASIDTESFRHEGELLTIQVSRGADQLLNASGSILLDGPIAVEFDRTPEIGEKFVVMAANKIGMNAGFTIHADAVPAGSFMNAYVQDGHLVVEVAQEIEPDLDGNGVVGFNDLLEIMMSWGDAHTAGDVNPDLNNDGRIDFNDLKHVLTAWD